jgi:hypothetical protein
MRGEYALGWLFLNKCDTLISILVHFGHMQHLGGVS